MARLGEETVDGGTIKCLGLVDKHIKVFFLAVQHANWVPHSQFSFYGAIKKNLAVVKELSFGFTRNTIVLDEQKWTHDTEIYVRRTLPETLLQVEP